MKFKHMRRAALVCGALLVGWSALVALQGAPAEDWNERLSNDGTYRVRWRSEPALVEFGERFRVELQASRVDGEPFQASLAVDARMPEHGHGMNREPNVKDLGGGHFEVNGLLFHMPGYWEIYFDLTRGAICERAQAPLDID